MSRLDELPPDQRAALSLLLRQHKSYAEVSALLAIDERAVRDRAHAALDALAPRAAQGLAGESRLAIGDYLLEGQADDEESERTRAYLRDSAPANAWARELARELASLAPAGLPQIPPSPAAGKASARPPWQRSSRRGGALLLVVLAAAVIVAVVLLTGSGGSHAKHPAIASKAKATAATTPKLDNEIPLTSPESSSTSVGVVDIVSEGSKTAFLIEARNIPAATGFYYAIWLYNSPTSFLALTKSSDVSASHTLGGISALPANAGAYHQILLTRETAARPTHPGPVVLKGTFSLH